MTVISCFTGTRHSFRLVKQIVSFGRCTVSLSRCIVGEERQELLNWHQNVCKSWIDFINYFNFYTTLAQPMAK